MKILFFLILSSSVFASEKVFTVNGKMVIVANEKGIMANRDCLKDKSNCQAYREALRYAHLRLKSNGKNPYATKCKDMKGEVIIGFDENGNENSFCQFEDKSLISCSSLGMPLSK